MKIIKNSLMISTALVTMGAFSILSAGNTKSEEVSSKPQKEWHVSNRVSILDPATDKIYEGTNPAVFGRVDASVDGRDQNDISTFTSVVNRKAAVVFVQADWAEHSGEYHSDYHDTKGLKDSWEMTVFSSVPNAEVTLKWDGLYEMTANEKGYDTKKVLNSRTLEDLHLIDTETGEVIDAVYDGTLNSYTFTMGAEGSRIFIWAQGSGNSYKTSKNIKSYIKEKQKEERTKAKEVAANAKKYGHKEFGLPPM